MSTSPKLNQIQTTVTPERIDGIEKSNHCSIKHWKTSQMMCHMTSLAIWNFKVDGALSAIFADSRFNFTIESSQFIQFLSDVPIFSGSMSERRGGLFTFTLYITTRRNFTIINFICVELDLFIKTSSIYWKIDNRTLELSNVFFLLEHLLQLTSFVL